MAKKINLASPVLNLMILLVFYARVKRSRSVSERDSYHGTQHSEVSSESVPPEGNRSNQK